MERRHVYLSNPSLTAFLPTFYFTPTWAGVTAETGVERSICLNYADAAQNQDWIYQFEVWNPGAALVNLHTVNAHTYLFVDGPDRAYSEQSDDGVRALWETGPR